MNKIIQISYPLVLFNNGQVMMIQSSGEWKDITNEIIKNLNDKEA